MTDQSPTEMQSTKKKNPYAVHFVFLSFIAPVALAYFMFYFVDVSSFTNKGEIFKPLIQIETLSLKDETGALIPQDELTYKWRIYSFVGSNCDESCTKRLKDVRQIHKRLGKNSHRLFQVIVHLDKADDSLKQLLKTEYPNVLIMYGDETEISQAIGNNAQLRENEIYFMDPMGRIMMRFTQGQPIEDVRFDLRKLLKASQIG